MVGKVADGNRLVKILRNTPIRQGQPGWNCVSWVKEALEMLKDDSKALGTSVVAWEKVRNGAYLSGVRIDHSTSNRSFGVEP
ncbi:hypothetical protein N7457_005220 [Penicillium paradoxum]|uniref:uncharacterized protein n=1 Tax=Penicillium paradoxum TaxID=176176 RepID=UPI0025485155|nr:uncharacterized protein N7457_005220 [Penicillium paradoxum]KAJ5780060.1 hypothetical protein N7457_005220 [Penicillium paradoxum]